MQLIKHKFTLQSQEIFDMQDITHQISAWITDQKLTNGLINIFIEHTTAALAINEYTDPGLLKDFQNILESFNPHNKEYQHNHSHACRGDNCVNGHSHCNALFLPTSLNVQVIDGKMNLGTWQRIFFIELDRSRPRTISLVYLGE